MNEVLTLTEAAAYVNLSQRNMRELLRNGVIPASCEYRQWRVLRSDLDTWVRTGGRNINKEGKQ